MIALAVMGGLVLLYGWNSVFLAPRGKAKAKAATELAAARKTEDTLRQQLSQLRKLAADTQAREAELARLGRLIPADADIAGAIDVFDEIAKSTQVAWSSFAPSQLTASASGPASVSLSINIGGTFHQILDYLRRLEQLERLVVVDGLSLGGGGNGSGGSTLLAVDVKARMFARSAPAAAGTVAAGKSGADKVDTAALPKGDK